MLNILIDIRIYFYILPLLLKGIHTDSLNISDIFWDVKMEMDFWIKKKTLNTKQARILKHNY